MKQQNGFTLFELLVSISIVGILMAIASVSFSNAQRKGRDARRMEDMRSVQNAAEMYYAQTNGTYPLGADAPGQWTPAGGTATLERFPRDPKGATYTQYSYTRPGGAGALNGADYCACALMEGGGANSDASCNQYGNGTTHYCVRNQQ